MVRLQPAFAAILAGLMSGVGILMLVRHKSSLGGFGVLAIYLQERHGLAKEEAEKQAENAAEQFEADLALMSGEFSRLLPAIVEALGGEQPLQ